MLISKKHKKVLINSRNPNLLLSTIPTAKAITFRGNTLVAVPHRLDETRVLRNMGYKVPPPVEVHYNWPGKYKPFRHQVATAGFLTMNPRAFVLNQIGTGKTLSVLWAYDYLRSCGAANKLLLVSPLSTLERVWADEIFKHFPHLTYVVLHATNSQRRFKLLDIDADIYIINHDGVKVMSKRLAERKDIDCVAVDELAEYRNAKTSRWTHMHRVLQGRTWVWGLTGSPTPKAPTDAWAQVRLICPDNVPKFFTRFRDMVMRQMSMYKWVPRVEAPFVVRDAMQPAVLYKREECLDLPPCTVSTRDVGMSQQQAKAYKDMLNRLRMEYQGGEVTAVNESVKMMKLVQIACGVAYGVDGSSVILPTPERIQAVLDIAQEADGKVIVYVPLTGGLHRIAEALQQGGYSVGVVHGETPKAERDEIFAAFQSRKDPEVLVAHPKCMAHGLTLTEANVIVWYIPTNDYSIYEQACGRITRSGQQRSQHIIHLEGSSIERRMYSRLENKGNAQGALLDLIKEDQEA